ncbi:MAG TPA: hypothetical protein VK716_17775 [Terracidiphilus sp.]|nr:hypothetical protein [Terracidiphilus sp.]
MTNPTKTALLEDLHFALNVMEEKSHLGLDSNSANRIKTILLRRIGEIESSPIRSVPTVVPFSTPESRFSA